MSARFQLQLDRSSGTPVDARTLHIFRGGSMSISIDNRDACCKHITDTVCRIGKISDIGPDEDFYDAGFSSINALELLLELESAYEVSIPDDRFIEVRTIRLLQELII